VNKKEVNELLGSYNQDIISIRVKVAVQRRKAELMYLELYKKLREAEYKSHDDYTYAHREAAKLIDNLFEPFREEGHNIPSKSKFTE
jgi:hypothetical protein